MKKQSTNDLIEKINRLLESKDQVLIAIDGHSGAGKSSLAKFLSQRFDCNIFHMDDFFLREEQRTTERLNEPGGNVDYERFLEEVLKPLKKKEAFQYRVFDCQTMNFGDVKQVQAKKFNIIEGSYSQHPTLVSQYDLKVFLDIIAEEQSNRILHRNGTFMHKRFIDEWIPQENTYFKAFSIKEKSNIVLSL